MILDPAEKNEKPIIKKNVKYINMYNAMHKSAVQLYSYKLQPTVCISMYMVDMNAYQLHFNFYTNDNQREASTFGMYKYVISPYFSK